MMRTYFARHSRKLNVDDDTFKALSDKDLIAIHYPEGKEGYAGSDLRSLNPADYSGRAKGVVERFVHLGKEGGYVCAVYRGRAGCKVGHVRPLTEVLYFEGPRKNVSSDRPEKATLKAIALDRVKNLDAESSIVLLSGRPRQGTFCEWHRDSGLVKALVENETWEPSVKRLSVAQQEVLCSEVMRTRKWADLELPQLESLLLPVGRTLKDIDIYGLGVDGNKIVAQVTNYQYSSDPAKRKLERLQSFGTPTAKVLFCDTKEILKEGDVVVFPLEEAFRLFKETTVGEKWLGAGAPSDPVTHVP